VSRIAPVPEMTPHDLAKPATYGTVMLAVDLVLDAFAKLDARVAAVEARPAVKYLGVHEAGRSYATGSLCTRSGSLWCATTDTSDTPGDGATAWVLIVKKGHAI